MKVGPILFSAPMVVSLLEGNKCQTRRLAWSCKREGAFTLKHPSPWRKVEPGDLLWVREAWAVDGTLKQARAALEDVVPGIGYGPYYRATEVAPETLKWRSPIYLPRWASRITLEVTQVRVQRLHDITEVDAIGEGMASNHAAKWSDGDPGRMQDVYRRSFSVLWNSLHKNEPWDSNPEVVAISFKVHKVNIDTFIAGRAA